MKAVACEMAIVAAERLQLSPNVVFLQPNGVDKRAPAPHLDAVSSKFATTFGDIHVPSIAARDRLQPSNSRARAAALLTVTYWILSYALLTSSTILSGNEHWRAIAAMRFLTIIVGIGFCYLIHLLLRHPRLNSTALRLVALALTTPVAAEAFAWTSFFAQAAVDPTLNLNRFSWSEAIRTIATWTWFFLGWAGLYLALMYSFDVHEEQRRSAELREQAHVAQLRSLHSQINPHFLFNSLNSVSALILDKNTDKAEEMVLKLARFLRLGLAADPTRKIPLELEIELQRSYLEIEQVRYPDLVVKVSFDDAIKDAQVPSLILQPIVENAVKYGVAEAPPPATISVLARSEGKRLSLEVIDSGKGSASQASGSGIGLANVRQRLALIYGESESSLSAGRNPDGRFRVQISLPLEFP